MTTVPLRGAHGTLHSNGIQKKHPEKLPRTFVEVTLFFTLITQKLFFAIWCLCWYNLMDFFGGNLGPLACLQMWPGSFCWRQGLSFSTIDTTGHQAMGAVGETWRQNTTTPPRDEILCRFTRFTTNVLRFAQSTTDDDMSIPTQMDVRHPTGSERRAELGGQLNGWN